MFQHLKDDTYVIDGKRVTLKTGTHNPIYLDDAKVKCQAALQEALPDSDKIAANNRVAAGHKLLTEIDRKTIRALRESDQGRINQLISEAESIRREYLL